MQHHVLISSMHVSSILAAVYSFKFRFKCLEACSAKLFVRLLCMAEIQCLIPSLLIMVTKSK